MLFIKVNPKIFPAYYKKSALVSEAILDLQSLNSRNRIRWSIMRVGLDILQPPDLYASVAGDDGIILLALNI